MPDRFDTAVLLLLADARSAIDARDEKRAATSTVLAGGKAFICALPLLWKLPVLAVPPVPEPKARPKTPNLGPPLKPAVGGNPDITYQYRSIVMLPAVNVSVSVATTETVVAVCVGGGFCVSSPYQITLPAV